MLRQKKTGKESAQTKEAVRKISVAGYEEFQKTVNEVETEGQKDGQKAPQLNILFTGEKNAQGVSWCPDCNQAEPYISKALADYARKNSVFIEVDVGDRDSYKNIENPFRLDKDMKVDEIPTLLRWKTPVRLAGEQCAKQSLLEMFFTEPSEED